MTSKEIIKRLIAHDDAPRFGYAFLDQTDFIGVRNLRQINMQLDPYDAWGDHPELKALTGFSGEVRRDFYGNIYGRFNGKTKGECIMGAIQDWDDYRYPTIEFDPSYRDELLAKDLANHEKFVLTTGRAIFSRHRDARLMSNALMDTIEYPDEVSSFIDSLVDQEINIIRNIAGCGVDGWIIYDDLGMQTTTFMSPSTFREIYKPAYKKLADAVHEAGMAMFLHSCGYNYGLMEDLIDAGIDVFQFDQPDAYPSEVLASEFADRVVFYSPVDIQKVLPTGDRELIERRALEMCELFRKAGGGWIAKDYPSYSDIGIDHAWAHWAQDVIVANSKIK